LGLNMAPRLRKCVLCHKLDINVEIFGPLLSDYN